MSLRASADGYDEAKADATAVAGKDAAVELKLAKAKEAPKGSLEVRVFDHRGKPMGASVEVDDVRGDATADLPFRADLPPGPHALRVYTAGFADVKKTIEVKAEQTESLRVPMKKGKSGGPSKGAVRAPTTAPRLPPSGGGATIGLATVSARGISVARPIEFTDERGEELTPASKEALDSLADALLAAPHVTKVRINAHTDSQGNRADLTAATDRQARAVRSYLVSKGVPADRLQAHGYGPDSPVAPNLTSRGRAKNRRVEFMVLEAN